MSVQNEIMALETLLFVFQNQMELGKNKLSLTLKHKDCTKDYVIGNIDKVFKSDVIEEIESGDMILLEHFDSFRTDTSMYLESEIHGIDSLGALVDIGKNINKCCQFVLPKGNNLAYFLIKDYPMFRYTIYRNEFMSEELFGKHASVVNNMAGKIRAGNGILAMLSTFTR